MTIKKEMTIKKFSKDFCFSFDKYPMEWGILKLNNGIGFSYTKQKENI